MENYSSLSLNDYHIKKTNLTLNRLHIFLHGVALSSLFYYRFTSLNKISIPILPLHVLILVSELILSFIWILGQASKWKPVTRPVYPDRLHEPEKLPDIDVFICTSDPNKEPVLKVMNTVISAMALDYPTNKLHVYLSDDGGSLVTLKAMRETWKFAKFWIPFCRKYEVKTRCPEAYFSSSTDRDEFVADKKIIEKRYQEFKDCLSKIVGDTSTFASRDHPPLIEVMTDLKEQEMPLLVYVAREKKPSHSHNFKAGALNVLLRVSAMISNSPYILVLDCDMYCNDPSSARQAMCFYLDFKLSKNLAFVQFPQKFYNISQTDIYDSQMRYIWQKWEGLDGLRGPILSGTCFYIKKDALYGTRKLPKRTDVDLIQMHESFGPSNEFIKSISEYYRPNDRNFSDNELQKELQFLASCSYDNDTKWGKEVGFRYFSVVEDYFTSFNLHCEGWISVYCTPSRPCFLGATPVTLGELLVQHTRWNVGLMQVGLSRFSPLLYGPMRMSTLQSMCYADFAYRALFYSVSLCVLAVVPQICLLCGIPLYPEVSSPFFFVFTFVFLSSQLKHIQEVFSSGHSIKTWLNEQRIWMILSLTSYFYATLDTTMEKIGLKKADFLPTNKVVDDEQAKRYQMGVYDFQVSSLFMVPLCSLYMLSMASFTIGFARILQNRKRNDQMIIQALITLFVTILFFPLLEGMVLRKDKGRISPYVSLVSVVVSTIVLLASLVTYN